MSVVPRYVAGKNNKEVARFQNARDEEATSLMIESWLVTPCSMETDFEYQPKMAVASSIGRLRQQPKKSLRTKK